MSKVGLSICALISVSVLGVVFADHGTDERRQELRSIVSGLCDAISEAALGYGDVITTYKVPSLSDGEVIRATITVDGAMVSSGMMSAIDHPCTLVHLWHWDGCELNWTTIAELDRLHREVTVTSGTTLEILAMTMMVDHALEALTFVCRR
jgi:hypothetical protein